MTQYCKLIWSFLLVVVLSMILGCSGLSGNAEKKPDIQKGDMAAEKGSIPEVKKANAAAEKEKTPEVKKADTIAEKGSIPEGKKADVAPGKGKTPEVKKAETVVEKDPVSVYKKKCGQCHIPYPPHFLPSGSWDKILGTTNKHFGETLEIDKKDKDIITSYLKVNGAERSQSKIPKRIMQSLEGNTPLRLTEIPYIQKKHRKYSPDALKKKSLESLSNCNACHSGAENWKF